MNCAVKSYYINTLLMDTRDRSDGFLSRLGGKKYDGVEVLVEGKLGKMGSIAVLQYSSS